MESIIKRLEELSKYQINWDELKNKAYRVSFDDKYGDTLVELITELRTLLKKASFEECESKLKELLDRYEWLDSILDHANKSLVYYHRLGALRELDKAGKELVISFLGLVFDNYVMRFNPEFVNSWEQFGMKDKTEMLKVLETINYLTNFYVSNSFAKTAIKKDFLGESGLCDEVCDSYSELVDRNYMEIKINLIFYKVKDIVKK